jgi:hypothetical protein
MTDTPDTSPEAVERWHEEIHGMRSGPALFEGQQEYVLYNDYAALSAERDREKAYADQSAINLDNALDRAEAAEAERDALKAENAKLREAEHKSLVAGFSAGYSAGSMPNYDREEAITDFRAALQEKDT